jgi:PEP-CTERM motif
MTKRSLFLTLAAGLLASMALATPSQAASTLVTENLLFGVPTPLATGLTAIDFTYTGAGTISDLSLQGSLPNTATVKLIGTNEVEVDYSSATTAAATVFTFVSSTAFVDAPGAISVAVTTNPSGATIKEHLSFNLASVPEPSSIALLGIGMTGFLAYRRLFKRSSVA